ncbi:hypothetical protein TWF225_003733 [Orbilia oligospora]|uniref:F-box domain-containing protein n=1 Tax=Orbilia oligospora TaxID=2813651 RepID=A0A8H2HL64_ORBOL|nr:hypothetical protein TWF225_003733 [Orbilia oligospora]KAF3267651.1 hypothetical protein TWF128_009167 [Orbilia oligospora]KAF3269148.1 hypothetical protein TWF217_009244 [Orbilia oligospora]TGJ63121.1 hypothetical protein EYR41_011065 [Orbilia oligospora]
MLSSLAGWPLRTRHGYDDTSDSSATSKVLSLPELFEKVLQFVTTKDINKFRRVSKTWRLFIDTSPRLSTIAFRNPRLFTEGEVPDLCEGYLKFLERHMLEGIRTIEIESTRGHHSGSVGEFKQFQKVAGSKISLSADLQVTQRASSSVHLVFYGYGSTEWQSKAADFVQSRPGDIIKIDGHHYYGYYRQLDNIHGVRCNEVFQAIMATINAFYSFQEEFFVTSISLQTRKLGVLPSLDGPTNFEKERVLWDRHWFKREFKNTAPSLVIRKDSDIGKTMISQRERMGIFLLLFLLYLSLSW